jgi:hypothetical protein
MHEIIASDILWGQLPGEDRFAIPIEIRKPFLLGGVSPTEWACELQVGNLYKSDIHGEGSLQPLCLAFQMVRSVLNDFLQKGGNLSYESGELFRLEGFWPAAPW